MLVFKYEKKDGAEYVSHLDMLRHINKIMRRAGIKISFSKGFNPHMHIFMSAPIAVGIQSESEYCYVDCEENAELFKDKFNEYCFSGIKATEAVNVPKKVNLQGLIDRATYKILQVNKFDTDLVLNASEFYITDKKGVRKDVRNKIYDLKFEGDYLIAILGFGNNALRPDLFLNELIALYGGKSIKTVKTQMFTGETDFDEYLKSLK